MPISIFCPQCNKTYRVKDELIGKRVRCPAGHALAVPPALPSVRTGASSDESIGARTVAPPEPTALDGNTLVWEQLGPFSFLGDTAVRTLARALPGQQPEYAAAFVRSVFPGETTLAADWVSKVKWTLGLDWGALVLLLLATLVLTVMIAAAKVLPREAAEIVWLTALAGVCARWVAHAVCRRYVMVVTDKRVLWIMFWRRFAKEVGYVECERVESCGRGFVMAGTVATLKGEGFGLFPAKVRMSGRPLEDTLPGLIAARSAARPPMGSA